jgi:hypothetical protein
MVQDGYSYATSSHHGQVDGAAQILVATQGQSTTTGEASSRREQKAAKKEKDRERKKEQRSHEDEVLERVCGLLGGLLRIKFKPKTTLADRSE